MSLKLACASIGNCFSGRADTTVYFTVISLFSSSPSVCRLCLALVEGPTVNIGSILRCQLRIVMVVHSALHPENCVLGTLSFLGRTE